MDFKQIQSIIKDFEKSSLTNLELEMDGLKIKLSKTDLNKVVEEVKVTDVALQPETQKGYYVKSPLIGTYYKAGGPNKKPFVEVGDKVVIGQTLCIIEAMKIMNEITAPVSGIIEKICAVDGTPIGFDETLMVINTQDDSK